MEQKTTTLLTPTRKIYVKCIAATFSQTFDQMKIKSWSEWSTLVASGVARLGNSPGLTFPLSRSSTRCNPINQLDICLIRFSFSYFCNVVASVPCDEVGASGAGAKKGNSSSTTSRWIVLPQVSCSKLYSILLVPFSTDFELEFDSSPCLWKLQARERWPAYWPVWERTCHGNIIITPIGLYTVDWYDFI